MKTRTAMKAFILMIILSFVSIRPCFTQTVGTTKPGIIVEQEAGKTLAHLTIPGTKVRDYTKPSFHFGKIRRHFGGLSDAARDDRSRLRKAANYFRYEAQRDHVGSAHAVSRAN